MFSLLPHSPAERPAQGAKSKIWLFRARFRCPGSQSPASRPGRTLIASPPRDGPACQHEPNDRQSRCVARSDLLLTSRMSRYARSDAEEIPPDRACTDVRKGRRASLGCILSCGVQVAKRILQKTEFRLISSMIYRVQIAASCGKLSSIHRASARPAIPSFLILSARRRSPCINIVRFRSSAS
jgi:hypothetical protein